MPDNITEQLDALLYINKETFQNMHYQFLSKYLS